MSSPEGWAEHWVLARASTAHAGISPSSQSPCTCSRGSLDVCISAPSARGSSQERVRGTEQNFDCDRCHQMEGGGTANLACLDGGRAPPYVGWALCTPCAAALQNEQRET